MPVAQALLPVRFLAQLATPGAPRLSWAVSGQRGSATRIASDALASRGGSTDEQICSSDVPRRECRTCTKRTGSGPDMRTTRSASFARYKNNVSADCCGGSLRDIKIEVWMPSAGWNGKFRGQGNGGFAGQIDYRALALAVSQGYVSAATDTGHAADGTDATWALGHPELIVDFAYRAIHEMTVIGKATVKAFYGATPQRAYNAS
jgi:hypothetical protein